MIETILEIIDTMISLIKIIAGIFSALCIVGGVYFAVKSDFYKKKIYDIFIRYRQMPKEEVTKVYDATKEWDKVKQRFDADDEAFWKLGVIEADKLIDTVMKAHGFIGATMGERMKGASEARIPSLNDLWKVHRLRNHLVHTADFHINKSQGKKAQGIYEQVLKELKAI